MSKMADLEIEIGEIKSELLDLNFNATSRGFNYWITAILLYTRDFYKKNVEDLYNEIARIYNSTRNNIERGMRTAILPAKENIQKFYNYKGRITNKTFLNLHYTNIIGRRLK